VVDIYIFQIYLADVWPTIGLLTLCWACFPSSPTNPATTFVKPWKEAWATFGERVTARFIRLSRGSRRGADCSEQCAASLPKKAPGVLLTEAGRACLQEWLAVPFQNDPPRNEFLSNCFWPRCSLSVRSHMCGTARKEPADAGDADGFEELMRKQASPHPHAPFWRLTLELGIALTRTALEWCDSAVATLLRMRAEKRSANGTTRMCCHRQLTKYKGKECVRCWHGSSQNGSLYSDEPLVAKRGLRCCEPLPSRFFIHAIGIGPASSSESGLWDAKTWAWISLDGGALASA